MKILSNLLKIKSLVTLILIITFAYITIYAVYNQIQIPEALLTIVSMVVGYYFGTQKIKEGE